MSWRHHFLTNTSIPHCELLSVRGRAHWFAASQWCGLSSDDQRSQQRLPGDQSSQKGYFVDLPIPVEWELHVDESFQGKSIKSVSFSSSSCFHQRRSCLGLIWGKEQNKEERKQKKTWAEWPRLQKHPPADDSHQVLVCQLRKHIWSWSFFICGQPLKIN